MFRRESSNNCDYAHDGESHQSDVVYNVFYVDWLRNHLYILNHLAGRLCMTWSTHLVS